MTIDWPPGALLRDSRSPDALDIRFVSADANLIIVQIGNETRRYKRNEAKLKRWLLPARTRVSIVAPAVRRAVRTGAVVGLRGEPGAAEQWTYVVDTDSGTEDVPEDHLRVLKVDTDDPADRLEMNAWRGPRRFFARLRLLERTTIWKQDSEGVPAFLGARVEPLFHQFYAARRCLLDRETRFLLADEVGLGKTIEAGLVIQSLMAATPTLRVLVVAPGTTSRQWLSELYSRFGGRAFTHVNTVRYNAETRYDNRASSLLKNDRLIVTTSLLRTEPKALSLITRQHWDVLVIDEGHHLANWPELMKALRDLSAAASSCLVLTATPGRGDDDGLLQLLKLVAPDTYRDLTISNFKRRLEPQRQIAERLLYSEELIEALLSRGEIAESDARELASQWKDVIPDDPIVVDRLAKMATGDGEAAQELVAHIQENYRVDRRIIRTRRRTLAEYGNHYAVRTLEQLEYEACAAEIAVVEQIAELVKRTDVPATWKRVWFQLSCATPQVLVQVLQSRRAALTNPKREIDDDLDPLSPDLGPAEEEAALARYVDQGPTFFSEEYWLTETLTQAERWFNEETEAPRRFVELHEWLVKSIADGNRKTLIFSQSRAVSSALAGYLRSRMGTDTVAVLTHDLEDDEIAEVARRFETRSNCHVLVSDEVGAEGRNFQFADAVVHLDQPVIVARVEQRIGRLDRIGRALDRPVLSVAVTGPSELERAVLGLNRDVFRVYERSIGGLEYLLPHLQRLIATALAGGASSVKELQGQLRPSLDAEEEKIDEAFSFFLDATRPEFERAKKLADLVAEREGDEDEIYAQDWCKELRIGFVRQQGQCVKIEARVDRLDTALPEIGSRDWMKIGSFVRDTALNSLALQYFAPGHIFIDALLASANCTQDARATVFFRDLGIHGQKRVFCVVVAQVGPDATVFPAGMSPGLLRRAEHYLPTEWVRSAFEVLPGGDVVAVAPGKLLQELLKDFLPTDRKCHPDEISQVLEQHPGLWIGMRASVDAARHTTLAQKREEIGAAASELAEALRPELAFLRVQQRGAIPTDNDRSLEERKALLASVQSPLITIDGVAVIVGTRAH